MELEIFKNSKTKYVEDSLKFTLILTIVGGFMNGYSYMLRGGSLVTMQSGNMARIGIAIYMHDDLLLLVSIIPVLGCLIGVTLARVLHTHIKGKTPVFWHKFSINIEIYIFIIVGLVPSGFYDHFLNFIIAVAAGIQFYNVKSYRGYMHGTVIASGNLKNLGHILGDLIVKKDKETLNLFLEYFLLFISFTGGAYLGCLLSWNIGIKAIWFCSAILFILIYYLSKDEKRIVEERAEKIRLLNQAINK